jgi:hypothetical protein
MPEIEHAEMMKATDVRREVTKAVLAEVQRLQGGQIPQGRRERRETVLADRQVFQAAQGTDASRQSHELVRAYVKCLKPGESGELIGNGR